MHNRDHSHRRQRARSDAAILEQHYGCGQDEYQGAAQLFAAAKTAP